MATLWRGGVVCVLACVSGRLAAHPEIEVQVAGINARIATEPTNADLFIQRGELYRIHQDWAAAETDYLRARELAPALPTVDFMLGNLKLDSGHPAEARPLLDRFLARTPDHVPGRIARARVLVRLGEPLAAARDFSHAIAQCGTTDPPQPDYYLERSRALVAAGSGHLDDALRGIDEGLSRLGNPVTLQLEAVDLELARGRTDAALVRLDRIVATAARRESWYVRRGEILERAGRLDEARKAFGAALEALAALPAARRDNRATQKLREQSQSALARLAPAH